MEPRTRTFLLLALATVLAAVVAIVATGPSRDAPLRFDDADLETFDIADIETAKARAATAAPMRAPTTAGAARATLLIRGRLLAGEQPVVGAEVRLELITDGGRAGRLVRLRRPARTAVDGTFVLEGIAPVARHAVLDIRHAGAAPLVHAIALGSGRTEVDVGDIEIDAGGVIEGTVTDAAGEPFADAVVELRPVDGNPIDRASRWRELLPPATSGADGAFRLAAVPVGAYRLTAHAPLKQRAEIAEPIRIRAAETTHVGPLRLEDGHELGGRVLDLDGRAIGGAQVRIQDQPGIREDPQLRQVRLTDDEGRFRIDHLPDRNLFVEVAAEGFLTLRLDTVATAAGDALEIELAPGLTVEGSVRDGTTGAAVTRFAAAVREADAIFEPEDGLDPRRAPTGLGDAAEHPDGRFRFDGLDAGTYRVEVLAPGLGHVRSDPFDLKPGAVLAPLTLTIQVAQPLEGVVVGARDATPIAGARVVLRAATDPATAVPTVSLRPTDAPPESLRLAETVTDETGAFRFDQVPLGRYALTAEAAGYVRAEQPVDANRSGLRIELAEPATLTGTVGGAGPGAEVIAYGGPGELQRVGVTDDGRYQIRGLRPGGYVVRAFVGDARDVLISAVRAACDAGGIPRDFDVTLGPGEERSLTLTIAAVPIGSVGGRAWENGAPAAGCAVALRIAGAVDRARWVGRQLTTKVAPDGTFEIDGVPAGSYLLVMSRTGPGRPEIHRETLVVRDRGRTEVDARVSTGRIELAVTQPATSRPAEVSGHVRLLVGAVAFPADIDRWQAEHPTLHAALRAGHVSIEHAPSGPAILVVDARGHTRVSLPVVVPANGEVIEVTAEAGARRVDDRRR